MRQLNRVAAMAHDGMGIAARPAHTPFDGDTLFSISTGDKPLTHSSPAVQIAELGAAAARCVARSIARGVYEASIE